MHLTIPLSLAERHALIGAAAWELFRRIWHNRLRWTNVPLLLKETHRICHQFSRNLQDCGPRIALRKGIAHALGNVFEARVYQIYRIDLSEWTEVASVSTGLDFSLVRPADHDLIEQIEGVEEWLEGTMHSRLNKGAMCLVALDGRRVAGFNLVSFGKVEIPLIAAEWVMGPGHAWSDQITVVPRYRGLGVAGELRYRVFNHLKARGITRFYGGTLAINTASRSLARKVGFREILEVHYQSVFGHRSRYYRRLKRQPVSPTAVALTGA